MSDDDTLKEFIKLMHSTLVASSSSGCTVPQFCAQFGNDWSSKPSVQCYAKKFGFQSVLDMLKSMPEEVVLQGKYMKPVKKEETKDVQDLIDRSQAKKIAEQKKKKRMDAMPAWALPKTRNKPLFTGMTDPPPGFSASKKESLFPQSMHPLYSKWSSIDGSTPDTNCENMLKVKYSNFGFNTSANFHTTSMPPNSFSTFFPTNSTTNLFRSSFSGNVENVQPMFDVSENEISKPTSTSYHINRTTHSHEFEDLEEGEILDVEEDVFGEKRKSPSFAKNEKPDSVISLQDGKLSPSLSRAMRTISDLDDQGFDSKEENQECYCFLKNFVVKRIPPKIHRIILILRRAGGVMSFKELQSNYENQYSTKLSNIELRAVMGVPEAKNTVVAFQRSPVAFLFCYELTTAGSGIVKLLADPNNAHKIDVLSRSHLNDISNKTVVMDRSSSNASTLSLHLKAKMSHALDDLSNFKNDYACGLTMASSNVSVADSGRSTPSYNYQLPAASVSEAISSDSEEMPLASEFIFQSNSPTSKEEQRRRTLKTSTSCHSPLKPLTPPTLLLTNLSQPAQSLLTFATMAYDLTSHELSLGKLYSIFKSNPTFSLFTHSVAQMLGLLLIYFDECFKVLRTPDDMELTIVATDVNPAEKASCLATFPWCLCVFPSVVDKIKLEKMDSNLKRAYIVHYEADRFDSGLPSVRFVVQLAAYEATRMALEKFLGEYESFLKNSKELSLNASSLVDGQYVLYYSSSCLHRCRVIGRTEVAGALDERKLMLECMDTGKHYDASVAESIFEFSFLTTNRTMRFPAMAVHCELDNMHNIKLPEIRGLLSDFRNRRSCVQIQLRDSFKKDVYTTVFRVQLYVPDENASAEKFKLYPFVSNKI